MPAWAAPGSTSCTSGAAKAATAADGLQADGRACHGSNVRSVGSFSVPACMGTSKAASGAAAEPAGRWLCTAQERGQSDGGLERAVRPFSSLLGWAIIAVGGLRCVCRPGVQGFSGRTCSHPIHCMARAELSGCPALQSGCHTEMPCGSSTIGDPRSACSWQWRYRLVTRAVLLCRLQRPPAQPAHVRWLTAVLALPQHPARDARQHTAPAGRGRRGRPRRRLWRPGALPLMGLAGSEVWGRHPGTSFCLCQDMPGNRCNRQPLVHGWALSTASRPGLLAVGGLQEYNAAPLPSAGGS